MFKQVEEVLRRAHLCAEPYQVFYLSTNTFDNPLFSAPIEFDTGEVEIKEESKQARRFSRYRQFCDELKYSLRTKLFVVESSLRRRLAKTRQLASSCAHKVLVLMGRNQETQLDREKRTQAEQADQFWANFKAPSSVKSIQRQQGKILSRLEQVIEAKRRSQGGQLVPSATIEVMPAPTSEEQSSSQQQEPMSEVSKWKPSSDTGHLRLTPLTRCTPVRHELDELARKSRRRMRSSPQVLTNGSNSKNNSVKSEGAFVRRPLANIGYVRRIPGEGSRRSAWSEVSIVRACFPRLACLCI